MGDGAHGEAECKGTIISSGRRRNQKEKAVE